MFSLFSSSAPKAPTVTRFAPTATASQPFVTAASLLPDTDGAATAHTQPPPAPLYEPNECPSMQQRKPQQPSAEAKGSFFALPLFVSDHLLEPLLITDAARAVAHSTTSVRRSVLFAVLKDQDGNDLRRLECSPQVGEQCKMLMTKPSCAEYRGGWALLQVQGNHVLSAQPVPTQDSEVSRQHFVVESVAEAMSNLAAAARFHDQVAPVRARMPGAVRVVLKCGFAVHLTHATPAVESNAFQYTGTIIGSSVKVSFFVNPRAVGEANIAIPRGGVVMLEYSPKYKSVKVLNASDDLKFERDDGKQAVLQQLPRGAILGQVTSCDRCAGASRASFAVRVTSLLMQQELTFYADGFYTLGSIVHSFRTPLPTVDGEAPKAILEPVTEAVFEALAAAFEADPQEAPSDGTFNVQAVQQFFAQLQDCTEYGYESGVLPDDLRAAASAAAVPNAAAENRLHRAALSERTANIIATQKQTTVPRSKKVLYDLMQPFLNDVCSKKPRQVEYGVFLVTRLDIAEASPPTDATQVLHVLHVLHRTFATYRASVQSDRCEWVLTGPTWQCGASFKYLVALAFVNHHLTDPDLQEECPAASPPAPSTAAPTAPEEVELFRASADPLPCPRNTLSKKKKR